MLVCRSSSCARVRKIFVPNPVRNASIGGGGGAMRRCHAAARRDFARDGGADIASTTLHARRHLPLFQTCLGWKSADFAI
jgi:hypothetical protein